MPLLQSKLDPGSRGLQVGVTSWVGKKLYHGFRDGYFDKESYDPDKRDSPVGYGNSHFGFWATPSFALAEKFGIKGGVVECYLDVKKALTFSKDVTTLIDSYRWRQILDTARVNYEFLADSSNPYYRNAYRHLIEAKPLKNPDTRLYNFLDSWWYVFEVAGYDGVCAPENGIPTVGALDFSQVTYGKRVKEGVNVDKWDDYDVTPLPKSDKIKHREGSSLPDYSTLDTYRHLLPRNGFPKLGFTYFEDVQPVKFHDKDGSVKQYSPQLVAPPPPVPKPKKDEDGQLSLFDSLSRRFGRFLAD
jgi:hypothetical protein